MSIVNEFKEFAIKGNMVDLAIGVIIGTAFNKVIGSLVSDIVMPVLGLFMGGIDFSKQAIMLHIPGNSQPPVEMKYGLFINTLVDFLIVAFVIFMVIKAMNRLRGVPKNIEETPKMRDCPMCALSIPIQAKKCGHCCSEFI